jgi:hypothetical protein
MEVSMTYTIDNPGAGTRGEETLHEAIQILSAIEIDEIAGGDDEGGYSGNTLCW